MEIMAEELEELWKKLSFTEEEADDVELRSGSTKAAIEKGKNCAVLKVLTHRSISLDALRKNLRMMWKPKKGVYLSEIEEDIFLVEFGDEKEKRRVLDMSPWSYEKQLVIIQDFEADLTPKEIELKWSPFWIQMFNLPLKSRTRETGIAIGSKLEEVLDVDVLESGVQWGKCLRVRIRIDVTKHLVRGKRVTIEGKEHCWINFRYERLPNFCYKCGMLSHGIKECPDGHANALQSNGEFQYGAWLRGEPMRRGFKVEHSSGMEGGFEEGGDTGKRLEMEKRYATELRVAGCVGSPHVPRLADRGDDSPTWVKTNLPSPKQLTENFHKEGKIKPREEKAGEFEAQNSGRVANTKLTHTEETEIMQWENASKQGVSQNSILNWRQV